MKTRVGTAVLAVALFLLPGQVIGQANQTGTKDHTTGAVTTIEPRQGDLTVLDIIKARAPGVVVVQSRIYIRGFAQDLHGAPAPLVIVDGMPGSLSDVNPLSVDKVTVLRDVASTAIYGTRGAGGVILITTKDR